jgi:hypothetical protein
MKFARRDEHTTVTNIVISVVVVDRNVFGCSHIFSLAISAVVNDGGIALLACRIAGVACLYPQTNNRYVPVQYHTCLPGVCMYA